MEDIYQNIILQMNDIDDLIRLYQTNNLFKKMLNRYDILQQLKIKFNIITDVKSFKDLINNIGNLFIPHVKQLINQNGKFYTEKFDINIDYPNIDIFYRKNNFHLSSVKSDLIFIGVSPKNFMTEWKETYGKEYDGNTILFKADKNKYMYIGHDIIMINTYYPIMNYISMVDEYYSSYAYAVDMMNNIYLIRYNAVILFNEELIDYLQDADNPYEPYTYDDKPDHILKLFKKYVKPINKDLDMEDYDPT
ncbi:MAG TPA: hypothetical protein VLG50_06615 [Candidatus Saccharimonadales bacterium]|nr:hypothetical protein [Candidatus Saccharimonadales bacterium]